MGFDFRDTDVYKLSLGYRKAVKKIISDRLKNRAGDCFNTLTICGRCKT